LFCLERCFWFLVFLPAGLLRSGKLPVLFLLTSQKSGFSPAGATRCTDSGQTLQDRRQPGSAYLCKTLPQSPQGGGNTAQEYKKIPLFGKKSPRFRQFLGAFLRIAILHENFKFHMIRIIGYGVIAKKPRVGKLGQIFRAPCRKNYTLERKMDVTFFDGHDELYHHANRLYVLKYGVCFFCFSVTLRVRSTVRSNKHCVAVYCLISTWFSAFFSEEIPLSDALHSSHIHR